ncbi:hypothetical protein DM860_011306 [Cuscuta australis]|uniref:PB1 domain-containing protein n=1 Tax=Cuscuta australis TaxID=267555 RepID=A0A328DSG0_9ASTE|nr:hypothetical protein DM860_011306 [Cuscuta australis]
MNSGGGKPPTIKILYSYLGRIVAGRPDGKLRYVGGYTRVLSVDRSISYAELMLKFAEACGESMNLKCKLPAEDLDVLVSISGDEELAAVIEEYDRVSAAENREMKIRAVLSPVKSPKKASPPSSPMSCFDFPAKSRLNQVKISGHCSHPPYKPSSLLRCSPPVVGYPIAAEKLHHCRGASNPSRLQNVCFANRRNCSH